MTEATSFMKREGILSTSGVCACVCVRDLRTILNLV